MTTEIVNITRQLVNRKVDEIVKKPSSYYESAFAIPQLRQKLTVRVLNQIPPDYRFSDEDPADPGHSSMSANRLDMERHIEQLIYQNILLVLKEEGVLQYFQAPPKTRVPQEPSHWFG